MGRRAAEVAGGGPRRRWPSPARVRDVAAGVTWIAMVATPLRPQGGRARRILSSVVVCGLATTTSAAVARAHGWKRASAGVSVTAVGTALVERFGTATGVPFGRYRYTGALRPQLDGVPVIVPLAWWAMAVPARETARAALGAHDRPATRIVAGAAALTAWDLFLDPQMVGEGYWRWLRSGRYRGIPITNFVGWFATSLAVMAALEVVVPVEEHPPAPDLVTTYGAMAAMETVGFAAFFRDRVVAAVGGAAMIPISVAAIARLSRAATR